MEKNGEDRKLITIIVSLLIALIMIFLSGCVDSLPVYEKTDEDGVSVYISGVRYKQLPILHWNVNPSLGKVIGYAGSRDVRVSLPFGYTEDNTETNFVFLQYPLTDYYGEMLYRVDRDILDVSVDSVDKVVWGESTYINSQIGNLYSNTIEDKEVIQELFDLLDKGERTEDISQIVVNNNTLNIDISLYCSDIPEAYYDMRVGIANGKVVIGREDIQYIYIPDDLLEKIAGKKIDIEEFL